MSLRSRLRLLAKKSPTTKKSPLAKPSLPKKSLLKLLLPRLRKKQLRSKKPLTVCTEGVSDGFPDRPRSRRHLQALHPGLDGTFNWLDQCPASCSSCHGWGHYCSPTWQYCCHS